LENTVKAEISGMQRYKTPAAPGEIVVKAISENEQVNATDNQFFRSGVSILLYLVKVLEPEIVDAVEEIAKAMDGPTKGHMKSLLRLIRYVVDIKDHELIIERKMGKDDDVWELHAYCNSDYAGNRDGCKSISSFIIYVLGCAISWQSRNQKSVTLSFQHTTTT
jgi:hypothetical protein